MNILLIGYMGSGKSAVAKELAKELDYKLIELDKEIVKKSGHKSIAEIFARDGEIKFRELETQVAKKLRKAENSVISAGGGVIMNQLNMLYLKENALTIYLAASFSELQSRAAGDKKRPLAGDPKEFRKLYGLRLPLYLYYADEIIDTESKDLQRAVQEIKRLIIKK